MEEVTIKELEKLIKPAGKTIVFLYTPMCGTCKLATRMLTIVEEAIPAITISKVDLNFAPEFAKHWGIESVPCLLIFINGKLKEKIYAFHSVDYLFEQLK